MSQDNHQAGVSEQDALHLPYGPFATLGELLRVKSLSSLFTFKQLRIATSIKGGARRSNLRGRGMEFAEVRPYQTGDDIRNIDWKVTARTQETYTKLFEEEKERPVFFLVDQTSSMRFGTRRVFKSVLACELAATLAWSANNAKDKVGALIFDEFDHVDLRPSSGEKSLQRFFSGLIQTNHQALDDKRSEQSGRKTRRKSGERLEEMLKLTTHLAKPGSIVVILSDFFDLNHNALDYIGRLGKHCSVVSIFHSDPLEGSGLTSATRSVNVRIAAPGSSTGSGKAASKVSSVRKTAQAQLKEPNKSTKSVVINQSAAAAFLDERKAKLNALFSALINQRSILLSARTDLSLADNLRGFASPKDTAAMLQQVFNHLVDEDNQRTMSQATGAKNSYYSPPGIRG